MFGYFCVSLKRIGAVLGWVAAPHPGAGQPEAGRIERALQAVAAAAVPVAVVEPPSPLPPLPQLDAEVLSTLQLRRHRPSLLPARLLGVARLNGRKGRRQFAWGSRAAPPRRVQPVKVKGAARRAPALVAVKRKPAVARKAVTRIIVTRPKRPSATIVRLHPCAPKAAVGQRLKRAA